MSEVPHQFCANCGLKVGEASLSCPGCHTLVCAEELEQLSTRAKWAESQGDLPRAREAWAEALKYLPPDSQQYRTIADHLAATTPPPPPIQPDAPAAGSRWAKMLGPLGGFGLLVWKFKGIALLALTKGKFLIFGLGKMQTLFSMMASMALYWHLYGWKFGLGFVLSIYIHEMGHVFALQRFGIQATAPMFIPGFGAFIRADFRGSTPNQEAQIALGGPIWGLGAALTCLIIGVTTDSQLWLALADAGGFINLFNLIPVWALDGGRAFRALSKQQRIIICAAAAALWFLTGKGMFALILAGGVYRCFTEDQVEKGDNQVLTHFLGLMAALGVVSMTGVSPPPDA